MKRIIKLFFLSLFLLCIMSGCGKNNTKNDPLCRVVTQVDITCQHEDLLIRRHYTDTDKIESVLIYLRLLNPLTMTENDPNSIDADIYEINVHLSDGARRVYRQKAHRYISKDYRPWKDVNPGHAAQLYALMRHYPSDPDVAAFAAGNTFAQKPLPCFGGFCDNCGISL